MTEIHDLKYILFLVNSLLLGGTLEIFGEGYAAGILSPLPYTRPGSALFSNPILE